MYLLEGHHWSDSSRSAALSTLFSSDPECVELLTGTESLGLLVSVLCASGSESTQPVPGGAPPVGLRAVREGDARAAQRLQEKKQLPGRVLQLACRLRLSRRSSHRLTQREKGGGFVCAEFFCKSRGLCPAKWVASELRFEEVEF